MFDVLHVQPMLGRAYTRAEDSPDTRVVVFTYEAWQRYFNGDPKIIGRQVRLALNSYSVIGVMPRGFRFPVDARTEYLMARGGGDRELHSRPPRDGGRSDGCVAL
jgi:putative ABC transport system permease protein